MLTTDEIIEQIKKGKIFTYPGLIVNTETYQLVYRFPQFIVKGKKPRHTSYYHEEQARQIVSHCVQDNVGTLTTKG